MTPTAGTALLAASLVAAGAAWAQIAPGTIQGTVLAADGKPVSRATIYYGRTGKTKPRAAAAVLPPVLSAKAGLDGRFTLANLPPGLWTICVEATGSLDPCHWSAAPTFIVAAGQTVANAAIRLDPAYAFRIRVDDPQGLLANEGKSPGARLQIGVHAPSGAFLAAVLSSKTAKDREYTVSIPLRGASARLFVSGGAFQLSDAAGYQLARTGKLSQVAAPDLGSPGAVVPSLAFTVTNLGKP